MWPDAVPDPLNLAEPFEVFPWGRWMPDMEPWLYPHCGTDTLLCSHRCTRLPKETSDMMSHLFDCSLRRNVLCREGCSSDCADCPHMSTTFFELELSRG